MTRFPLRTAALDEEGCRAVHEATIKVLEETGVEVQHDEALTLLRRAGARVDGTRVRLPRALVDQALQTVPGEVSVSDRGDGRGLRLKSGVTYFGTGSDCLSMLGPTARDRRPVTLADVEQMAMVQEKLPNIDFVLSMAHPHELDPVFAPVAQFAAMVRGTRKPLIMVPENAEHLERFREMAAIGGAADSWALYAMPTPPLVHGRESADRLVRAARLEIPIIYASALLQGATAPASPAAFLVVANAEMLSGLVVHQLAHSGAPFVMGVAQGAMNPSTAHVVYCGPEEMAVQQASADLIASYGLPSFGDGGCSDAQSLDEQWAFEAGMTLVVAAQAGVTLLHDVGYVGAGTASSYEAVVLLDEMIAWVKAYLRGVVLDEESLALDEIAAVGPGGTHLGRKYTRRHLRDYHRPTLVAQESHDAWRAGGGSTLLERAAARTAELRAAAPAWELDDSARRDLDRVLHGARATAGEMV